MLIFREKEILSVAKSAFIENADFISTQKWCKNRLCNGILFRKRNVFFGKIGISEVEIGITDFKKIHQILSQGNLLDGFCLLGMCAPKLTLVEKSIIGTMLSPKWCPRADLKTFEKLSLKLSERDFFFFAAQCKFLAQRLNKRGIYTPIGTEWNVSSVDICVGKLFN